MHFNICCRVNKLAVFSGQKNIGKIRLKLDGNKERVKGFIGVWLKAITQ